MKTEKLDDAINSITYILDTLMAHRDIVKTGNCNTCWVRDTCKYAPKLGQLVRYNCPHLNQSARKYGRMGMSYRSKELFVSYVYEIYRNGEKEHGHGNAIIQQDTYCRVTGKDIRLTEQEIIKMNGWENLDPHVCIMNWRRFEE